MEKKPVDILAGSDEDSDGGEDLSKVQINEEYARRFEHNKRREALQRLEERRKQASSPPLTTASRIPSPSRLRRTRRPPLPRASSTAACSR